MKKRILIGAVVLALAVAGAAAALWYRDQTEEKVVRGSASVEFVTTSEPAEKMRSKKVVERRPWPMYGYNPARTSTASDFRHRPPYRTLWFVETRDYIEYPPAVADDRVFVANQDGLFLALGARKGRILWRKKWGRCVASGPAVAHGLVFQSVMNPRPCKTTSNRPAQRGFVIAMDVETGKVRWRFDTGVVESSPLVVGRLLFVGSWDHRVYALDAKTGKVRWSYDTGEELNGSAAYANGTIFIGGNDGHVFALAAARGGLRWRASSFARFGRREYFYATPAIAYGRVYIGNSDGTLYAFGVKSGDLLWAQEAGTYVYTKAAIWRNRVYVGSYDGRFSAFDAATGDVVWRWNAPGAIHGAPTAMAGLVYFSTTNAAIATSRAKRYIKAGKRGTYALDAATGKLVWRRPGVGQYSPIVADEERVYLTGSTRVFALEPKAAKKRDAKKDAKPTKQRKKKRRR